MRVEHIGSATLYCGDCMEVLPELESVAHTITDPPYEAEAHTLQCRVSRGAGAVVLDPLTFEPITEDLRAAVSDWCVMLSDGWFLAFCQAEAVGSWRDAMQASGASWKRACVWVKPDGMPQYSGDRPGMGYESIAASWCGEGKSVWNGGGKHGVYTVHKGESVRWGHETQKPLRLMESLIADFTQPDDLVLDPFMGSGTTGVACSNLGRRFIGIEREPRYFEIACERLRHANSQLRLFA